jgi:hypothetical protein
MDVKEYQSGYYCKQNFLKFIIADVGLSMPKQISTSVDVEKRTGIHRKKVGNALWHYKKVGVPYFRRLQKKDSNGLNRWKVTKSGEKAWRMYFMRIKRGFDLNLVSSKITRMPSYNTIPFAKPKTKEDLKISSIPQERIADYLGLTKYGVEVLGLANEDLLKIASGLLNQ